MRSAWVCPCDSKNTNNVSFCRDCGLKRGHTRGPSGDRVSDEFEADIASCLARIQSVETIQDVIRYLDRQYDNPMAPEIARMANAELSRRDAQTRGLLEV